MSVCTDHSVRLTLYTQTHNDCSPFALPFALHLGSSHCTTVVPLLYHCTTVPLWQVTPTRPLGTSAPTDMGSFVTPGLPGPTNSVLPTLLVPQSMFPVQAVQTVQAVQALFLHRSSVCITRAADMTASSLLLPRPRPRSLCQLKQRGGRRGRRGRPRSKAYWAVTPFLPALRSFPRSMVRVITYSSSR